VRQGDGGGDEHEAITVHLVPLDGAQAFLRAARARGALVDPKVLAGLWLAGVPWDGCPIEP
jgi:ADP-ribose pyrophosphatase